ncbi:MAG: hypothetical protein ABF893_07390 [Gluconacetobacter liquefaciens]
MECRAKDLFVAYVIATFATTLVIVLSRIQADFSHLPGASIFGIVFLALFIIIAISAAIPCAADLYIVKTIRRGQMLAFVSGGFLWGGLGSPLIFASLPNSALAGVPEPGFFLAYRSTLLFSGPVFAAAGATGTMIFWFIVARLRRKDRPV